MNLEQSLLGSIIQNGRAIDYVIDVITESDFELYAHARIWRAMVDLTEAGTPIDVITVAELLDKAGDLDQVGGFPYVGQLHQAVPNSHNVQVYAKSVKESAMTRQLEAVAHAVHELAQDKTTSVGDKLDAAQALVMEISERRVTTGPRSASEMLPTVIDSLESRMDSKGIVGLPTGWGDMDKMINGLREDKLIIVAGRPGMGKTTFATNMARVTALSGVTSLVFSLEMGADELLEREMAAIGTVDHGVMQSGQMQPDHWTGIATSMMQLKSSGLLIDDTPDLTISDIRTRARRVKRQHDDLKLIVVDYIQLMRGKGNNRNEEISGISRGLKSLAKELHVPVVALSQLSRDVEKRADKRPVMSDLRDSGSIEQDADIVIFVYRDEVYNENTPNPGVAEIIIRKNRANKIGKVPLAFQGQYCRFLPFIGEYQEYTPEVKRPRGMQ